MIFINCMYPKKMSCYFQSTSVSNKVRVNSRFSTALVTVCATLVVAQQTRAQTPEPGRVYESVQPKQTPLLQPTAPALTIQRAPSAAALPDAGAQIQVTSFRLVGIKQLQPEPLLQRLQPLTNQALTVAQINSAADLVTQAYREAGFMLAQAVVLPQVIDNGIITITINEGNLQKLEFTSAASSSVPSVVQSGVSQAVRVGEAVNAKHLEEALLLGNDVPGRGVSNAEITFDSPVAESASMRINYQPAPRLQGLISLDNGGNRYTGKTRVIGQLQWNEPFSAGDQLALTLLSTGSKLNYAQVGYRVPLSLRATLGASASVLQYELCCQNPGTEITGSAKAASIDLAYNLRMERREKLFLLASLDTKTLQSELNTVEQTDRQVSALSLGMRGSSESSSGALRSWALGLRAGQAELANLADLAADTLAARTQGRFSKITGSFYQNQALSSGWTWLAQARGQASLEHNLEGSEKFVLGGPDGVRAYPSGEGVGDKGWLASIEVRYSVAAAQGLSLLGFVDGGGVSRYSKNASLILGNQINSYSLAGSGLGLRYETSKTNVALFVAKPIGSNRGKDAAGINSEGRRDGKTQAWLQAMLRF
jgi:hemolysin activation/secretion protein